MTNPQIQFTTISSFESAGPITIDADVLLAAYTNQVNTLTSLQIAAMSSPRFGYNATSFKPQHVARTFLLASGNGPDSLVQNQCASDVYIAFGVGPAPAASTYSVPYAQIPPSAFVPVLPPLSALPLNPNAPGTLRIASGQSVLLTTNQAVLAATQNPLVIGGGIASSAQAAMGGYGFVSAMCAGLASGSVIIASGTAQVVYNF